MTSPPILTIRTTTAAAQNWLRSARGARILHVFDNSLNLANAAGEVLSLVNPELGPGPFAMVLANPVDFTAHWQADTPVTMQDGSLILGSTHLDTAAAEHWNPEPPWMDLTAKDYHWAAPRLTSLLAAAAIQPQVAPPPLPDLTNIPSQRQFAAALAGRGPGLTPAGDDFLVGFMHALWLLLGPPPASQVCMRLAAAAVPATTTLSGAWLHAAKLGKAGAPWHSLFEAMHRRDPSVLETAAQRILHTGHSSGADALAGFLAAAPLNT